jgi:hypothetical protein
METEMLSQINLETNLSNYRAKSLQRKTEKKIEARTLEEDQQLEISMIKVNLNNQWLQ